jgi:adenine-specific DNA methylase
MTRWGTENGPNLQIARGLIRKAYGARAPKVLDPFAGGGAIPFEAMRLGCAVTANDYNPVAWIILKCTLEYPQRLAGRTWPLPATGTTEEAPPVSAASVQPMLASAATPR